MTLPCKPFELRHLTRRLGPPHQSVVVEASDIGPNAAVVHHLSRVVRRTGMTRPPPRLGVGRSGDAEHAAGWTLPPMTSFDTGQNRATPRNSELTSVRDGAEIRYPVADLRLGVTLLDPRRRTGDEQLLRQ
jgi:hypothetical protein